MAEKRGKGRPTSYSKKKADKALFLFSLGATEQEVADVLDISNKTLYNWYEKHPDFLHAKKENKSAIDEKVVNTLFQRATGAIKIKETTINPDGSTTVKEKEIAPDTTAMIFWLKNRRPQDWRDKQEIEHSGEIHAHFDPEERDI